MMLVWQKCKWQLMKKKLETNTLAYFAGLTLMREKIITQSYSQWVAVCANIDSKTETAVSV
jgi:hypothetical protein